MNGIDDIILKQNFKHLYQVAESLPMCQATKILKSNLLAKCRQLQSNEFNSELPQFKESVRCPKCSLSYDDGPPTFRILPNHKHTRFLRKVIKKHLNNKKLRKYQMKLYKRCLKNRTSRLVIKCNFCEKLVYRSVGKPQKFVTASINNFVLKKSTKKKRKKDRFSGLNESAFLLSTPKNTEVSTSSKIKPNMTSEFVVKNPIQKQYALGKRLSKLKKHFTQSDLHKKTNTTNKLKYFLDNV